MNFLPSLNDMNNNEVISLKESDVMLLKSRASQMLAGGADPAMVARLKSEMMGAKVLPDSKFPPHIVALGSRVEIQYCDDGEQAICRLVLPQDVLLKGENVSVVTPLGLALLGRQAGQLINWPLAIGHGSLEVKVLKVIPSEHLEPALSYA